MPVIPCIFSATFWLPGKVPDMDSPRVAPAAKRGGSGGQSAMVADASAAAQAALRSSDSDSEVCRKGG